MSHRSSEPNQADLDDKPIGVANVDRILDAVGHHPPDLDRAQLAKRLGGIKALLQQRPGFNQIRSAAAA
jgi:hypothetical protein